MDTRQRGEHQWLTAASRTHGVVSGSHQTGLFLDLLADNGYSVVATGDAALEELGGETWTEYGRRFRDPPEDTMITHGRSLPEWWRKSAAPWFARTVTRHDGPWTPVDEENRDG